MQTIKQQTISGFKWTAIANYGQKALSFVTFIIMARLLEPRAFGLFAMAFIVIDGFGLFKNLGIDTALIQRKEDIERASHTAFWMFPAIGILMFTLLCLTAPLAAIFMREPALTSILMTLGVIFILGSIENVPIALLTKELKFKGLAVRELVSSILYTLGAISLAYLDFGVWSLVYAYLLKRISMLILSWSLSGYKPKFIFDKAIANQLLHFGKFIFGTALVWFSISNLDNFLVGKKLGAALLGYYALAFNISSLTITHLSSLVARVMYPTYAKLQNDLESIKRISLKIIKTTAIFSIPFGTGLFLLSKEIVEVVYGEKWLPMVPVLKIFSLCSMILPLVSVSGSIYIACGKPKWDFYLGFSTICLIMLIVPFLIDRFGLIGAALGMTSVRLIIVPVILKLMEKLVHIYFHEILEAIKPAILSSLVMSALILVAKNFMIFQGGRTWTNVSLLLGFSMCCAGVYFTCSYFIDRKIFQEIKTVILKT